MNRTDITPETNLNTILETEDAATSVVLRAPLCLPQIPYLTEAQEMNKIPDSDKKEGKTNAKKKHKHAQENDHASNGKGKHINDIENQCIERYKGRNSQSCATC